MKTRTLLATLLLAIGSMTMNAQPMSYYSIRDNARFLTDRMAYSLGIADHLLDDLYMINYDYICGVNDYLDDVAIGYHYDDYMAVCYARDAALRRLLTARQWDRLIALDYFYRPISFAANRWRFAVYSYYPINDHFYFRAPHHYASYRGGRMFGGMHPAGGRVGPGRIGGPAPHVGPAHHGNGFAGQHGAQPGNHGGNVQPGHQGGDMQPVNGNRGNNRGTFDSSRSSSRTTVGNSSAGNRNSSVGNRTNSAGANRGAAGPSTRSAGTTNASSGTTRGAGRR